MDQRAFPESERESFVKTSTCYWRRGLRGSLGHRDKKQLLKHVETREDLGGPVPVDVGGMDEQRVHDSVWCPG